MSPLSPVPFTRVRLKDPGPARRVVEACLTQCEATGRVRNFALAAGLAEGKFAGRRYDDSDVYKTLQGAAELLALAPDEALRARVDGIADLVAAAQRPDGYLNTYYTLVEPDRRWIDLEKSHELYCLGHLLEAALAAGGGKLMDAALRFLALVDGEFGPGRREAPPGHQEIELALLRLFGATGERRWRDLAAFFLDARGRGELRPRYGEYAQDHLPVREQREAVGHAVRALYQYCGMADLAAADGDPLLLAVVGEAFGDIVGRKMYVTGGVGSRGSIEGFGEPWDLPIEGAYCETCAAIALAMLAQRFYLATANTRYADVYELVLLNAVLAGVSLSGDRFFYANPLRSGGEHGRVPWFTCACCPTNLARFLPVLGGDICAVGGDTLAIAQYASSEAEVEIAGTRVKVTQETGYPFFGAVRLKFSPEREVEFEVALRVPGWCRGPVGASVNGRPVGTVEGPGFLRARGAWRDGDEMTLRLPVVPTRVRGRREVAAERGLAALRLGPLVYCLEAMDNTVDPREACLPPEAALTAAFAPDLLGGVAVITANTSPPLRAIPYARWGNREPGAMAVWLRER